MPPFPQWEIQRSQEILTANGFGHTPEAWQQAAHHSDGLIRVSAYHLLSHLPEPENIALFEKGLTDADESVKVLAAYGLLRLGDESHKDIIEEIARLNVEAYLAAPRAAGILGSLGEATAFKTILRGMQSELSVIRIWSIKNVLPFAALHGQAYGPDKNIDIWAFYAQALQDPEANVRAGGPSPTERAKHSRSLKAIRP